MNETTKLILAIEWELFGRVQNIGGRADCQDNRDTFLLMRSSQLDAWTEEMRRSWLDDLHLARAEGRNPLAEKYGYMMERTDPIGYARIADSLPPRSPEKLELISHICAVHLDWMDALRCRYPALTGRGRAVDSDADSIYATSFSTYLAGELATYSTHTLKLYWSYVQTLVTEEKNLNEQILKNTVEQYGYPSLESAEIAFSPVV